MNQENTEPNGPALYRIAAQAWTAQGVSRRSWLMAHDLSEATVSRWETGAVPSFHHLRVIAAALGLPILQLMVEVGLLSADEAGADQVDRTRDVRAAIASSSAPERLRTALLAVVDLYDVPAAAPRRQRRARI